MKYIVFVLTAILIGLLGLTGCQSRSQPTLKVAATSIPHAEILELIKPDLKEKGIDLEIIVVEDFSTPNRALNDKEVDANFFQHLPFLEMQNKDFGYKLLSYAKIHLEPMSLYSKRIKSLDQLKAGSVVAIPIDPTNQARALNVLEQTGLISLKRQDAKTNLMDIAGNPLNLKFVEIDSPMLSRALEDVDLAAMSTNFALQAGLSPQEDGLAAENAQSLFANILVIRQGEEDREDLKALREALTSPKVRAFIEKEYQGAVIPSF